MKIEDRWRKRQIERWLEIKIGREIERDWKKKHKENKADSDTKRERHEERDRKRETGRERHV